MISTLRPTNLGDTLGIEDFINKIPENILKENCHDVDVNYLMGTNCELRKRTIRALSEVLDWDWVGQTQELDIFMIINNLDKFKDINTTLAFQLQQDFICVEQIKSNDALMNKIDWDNIDYRIMTYAFNKEFADKININLEYLNKMPKQEKLESNLTTQNPAPVKMYDYIY